MRLNLALVKMQKAALRGDGATAGGPGRAGVIRYPLTLTRAVHENKAVLTLGGATVFVLPGGGIPFYVDVEQVQAGAFSWTPTPAKCCSGITRKWGGTWRQLGRLRVSRGRCSRRKE